LHKLCHFYQVYNLDKVEAVGHILVNAGGDIEAKDAKGCTPLHHLVQTLRNRDPENQEPISKFVRTYGPNVNATDGDGNSALHMLFEGRPSEIFKDLVVNLGADARATNRAGESLMHVLMRGSLAEDAAIPVQLVQQLAEYGISSTHQDQSGNTPLHVLCQTRLSSKASTWPSNEAVDLLLSLDDGLSLEMENHRGLRQIHIAAATNKLLVAKLISKGASTSNTTKNGQNILHIAASAREGDIAGFMVDHYQKNGNLGLFLDQPDEDGCTPLHAACKVGFHESVRLLVEAGAKLDARDNAGCTPLDICKQLLDEVVKNSGDAWDSNISYGYQPYQHGQFGSEPNTQTNDGGQMMEIIYFLGQAMGESPVLRGDYMPNTQRRVYRQSCFAPVIRKGDYGVFRKCIDQGMKFTPRDNKRILDPLTIVVNGGYAFLFDLIAQSFPDNSFFMGNEDVAPYFLTAITRTQPNMPILQLLVEKFGADVNMRKRGSTSIWTGQYDACESGALHIIARGYIWWHKEALKYLLAKGADPNLKDGKGRTALQLAVKSAYHGAFMSKEIMWILLEHGADPNLPDESGIAPLDEKIRDPEVTELLVRFGGKPNHPDRSFALCKAITKRDLQAVRDLLESGQDPNILPPEEPQLSDSSTQAGGPSKKRKAPFDMAAFLNRPRMGYPLEIAVTDISDVNRHPDALTIIRLLLEHGADPFKQSKHNEKTTILHHLLENAESADVCEILLGLDGLGLETRDSCGNTLFLAACKYWERRWKSILDVHPMRYMALRQRGADIRVTNNNGDNALHIVVSLPGRHRDEKDRKAAMSTLIGQCPELVHQRNNDGFTPFQTAWKNNDSDWSWQVLLDAGADFTTAAPDGTTVLHASLTVRPDGVKWVKRFLDIGLDLNARNRDGETPVFAWVRSPQPLVDEMQQLLKAPDESLDDTDEEEEEGLFIRTISFLKEAGFDFHLVNSHGQNLLHVIAQSGVEKRGIFGDPAPRRALILFKEFVAYGLDPSVQDTRGWTALVG
jgi:ankyrin repeat protein